MGSIYSSNQFCVVARDYPHVFFKPNFFSLFSLGGFVHKTNSFFKGIRICLIFLCFVIFLTVNCSFLLEIYLWRFFEAWVDVDAANHLEAILTHNHLKLTFPFEVFSDYIGNRIPNPREVQFVVMNSQGITLLFFPSNPRTESRFPCCALLHSGASLWVQAFYENLNFSPCLGCAPDFTFCPLYWCNHWSTSSRILGFAKIFQEGCWLWHFKFLVSLHFGDWHVLYTSLMFKKDFKRFLN